MCGIYGVLGRPGDPGTASTLERMDRTLLHRGPDGTGAVVRGPAALGCRRLAIIDVAGGAQPLTDETGDVTVVCNGEIYNHRALRRDLVARGHRFRSESDAEVLPHLYEERGPAFVDVLDGMFALALWDARRERLLLARDRLGEKPLYYAQTPSALLFASEPKALVAAGADRTPDWAALSRYLWTGCVAAPASAFRGVRQLPPAGRLVVQGEHARFDRYWDVAALLAGPALDLDLATAAREIRRELARSTEAALASDVPLGVFLSGGLDSTAVTALARRVCGPGLQTFAIGFEAPGFDERPYAELVARSLGTRHRALTITPALFLEGLRDLVPLLDEPLADPALVPTYLLARFARADVKVALSGEGGDELFAGYPTYLGGRFAPAYRRLPARGRRALHGLTPLLGASRSNTSLRYLLRRFLEEGDAPAVVRHRNWTGCFSREGLASIAAPGSPLVPPAVDDPGPARTEVDLLLGLDLAGHLPDDLLVKLDRASMAASLEARAPFLDHHLVELACRLPAELKLRGLVGKRVLRRAVDDLVPPAVRRRVKRGLTVPLAAWLAGPLRLFARDVLSRLDPRLVRPEAVKALFDAHVERRRDNRRELWALVMLQLWLER